MDKTQHTLIFGPIIQKQDLIDNDMLSISEHTPAEYLSLAEKNHLSAFFLYDVTLKDCVGLNTSGIGESIIAEIDAHTYMRAIDSCEGHEAQLYYGLIVANDENDYISYPDVVRKAMQFQCYTSYIWGEYKD